MCPEVNRTGLMCHNTTTASDCQTLSGQIPEDKSEEGIDDYGVKDFEKRKV